MENENVFSLVSRSVPLVSGSRTHLHIHFHYPATEKEQDLTESDFGTIF